jgi:hypothetical protein
MQDMINVSPNSALLMIPGRNASNSKAAKSQKAIFPPLDIPSIPSNYCGLKMRSQIWAISTLIIIKGKAVFMDLSMVRIMKGPPERYGLAI